MIHVGHTHLNLSRNRINSNSYQILRLVDRWLWNKKKISNLWKHQITNCIACPIHSWSILFLAAWETLHDLFVDRFWNFEHSIEVIHTMILWDFLSPKSRIISIQNTAKWDEAVHRSYKTARGFRDLDYIYNLEDIIKLWRLHKKEN